MGATAVSKTVLGAMRAACLLLLLPVLLLCGCGTPASGAAQDAGANRSWTLCLYLCGSDLESKEGWASATINELRSARIPEGVSVVVETGGASSWQNQDVRADELGRYVVKDGELVALGSVAAASMGSANSLADFLTFCEKSYPAQNTAVVLWNHGGGPLKGACFDETHGKDSLSLGEMRAAFAKGVEARGGAPYAIVGLDACLMGSLETAATFDGQADYLVASEEVESGAGWDYAALLAAMEASANAEDVAKAACDGYMAKCASSGIDAAATLAAIDLGRVQDVRDALLGALASLEKTSDGKVGALRRLAVCSGEAESFGGKSAHEGSSDLVDLKEMAKELARDPALNGDGWDAVCDAVDAAVTSSVRGAAVKGANGLSIWYPRAFTRAQFEEYVAISPLDGYAKTLDRLFSASLGQVAFADDGSVDTNGKLHVTIAPQAADSFYGLYVVNRRVDGDYEDMDVTMTEDWDNLSFVFDPAAARRITLDGMTLDAHIADYDFNRTVYACPVTINADKASLRVSRVTDGQGSGRYELLGIWTGLDDAGHADRIDKQLASGDVVSAVSLTTGKERQSVTISGKPVIEEAPLEAGTYECHFVALDLHGNEYSSKALTYTK